MSEKPETEIRSRSFSLTAFSLFTSSSRSDARYCVYLSIACCISSTVLNSESAGTSACGGCSFWEEFSAEILLYIPFSPDMKNSVKATAVATIATISAVTKCIRALFFPFILNLLVSKSFSKRFRKSLLSIRFRFLLFYHKSPRFSILLRVFS